MSTTLPNLDSHLPVVLVSTTLPNLDSHLPVVLVSTTLPNKITWGAQSLQALQAILSIAIAFS